MNYYLCAYGNTTRLSIKCSSKEEAAKYCYGVVDNVTVLNLGGRSPKYVTNAKKKEWHNTLSKLHKSQTGFDL